VRGNLAGTLVRGLVVPHWRAFAGAAATTVLVTAAEILQPFPLKWALDHLLEGRSAGAGLSGSDLRLLLELAAAVLAIAAAGALGSFGGNLLLRRAGERIAHTLRVRTYEHLQRLSLAFHDRRQKGDLVTRLTEDCNQVGEMFAESLGAIAQSWLVLIGMAAVSLAIDPPLAAALFLVAPPLSFVTVHYRRRLKEGARAQRSREGEIASLAGESLSAMRVVKAFGSESFEGARVADRSADRLRFGIQVAGLEARYGGLVELLGALTMAIVLVVGSWRVASGAISAGALVVFAQYARRMYAPLKDIAKQSTRVSKAMARAERVADVLAADDVLAERPDAWAQGRATGLVELDDVRFGYDPARPVLNGVGLRVEPGEVLAVVGPSGAGKSTIAALIARFYDPTGGVVRLDGRDARDCSVEWLREQLGLLLQDTVLFSGTVADNVAYGLRASRTDVEAACRAAGAHDFLSALPDGYDTVLGAQGVGLSGGQRQRIGIARVLLRNPAVLLLDEPTTGLDAVSEAHVVRSLRRLMHGRTTILVTHSMTLARQASRVAVLEAGRVVECGTPAELESRRDGLYRKLLAEQGLVAGSRGLRSVRES